MSNNLLKYRKVCPVKPIGPINAPIVVLTDQPSRQEHDSKELLTNGAKEVFDNILEEAGFDLSKIFYIPCCTEQKLYSDKLTPQQLKENFNEYILPIINEYPRQLIICLGNNSICATGVSDKPEKINSFRSKLLEVDNIDAPIIATLHPWLLMREPDANYLDVLGDLKIGYRFFNEDFEEQVPIVVERLETLDDLEEFAIYIHQFKNCFFDIETTGLDPYKDISVSIGFYLGEQTEKGEYIAYVWSSHDKLISRYTDSEIEQFKDLFTQIFKIPINYVGQNSYSFDDVMLAHWLDAPELIGNLSTTDTMYQRWVVSKNGGKGLKENVTTYLGYCDYDKTVRDLVSEIAARRGRVMYKDDPNNADDFRTLEWYNVKPELASLNKTKGQGYKWPEKHILDKKAAAYALIDLPVLEEYLGYDCVYTGLLYEEYNKQILQEESLITSNTWRHEFGKLLIKAEDRGFILDEECNKDFSEKLNNVIDQTDTKIKDEVFNLDPDITDFNPQSTQQLSKILFGSPTLIPIIDETSLYDQFNEIWSIHEALDSFHENFYGDFSSIKELVVNNSYALDFIQLKLEDSFVRQYGKDLKYKVKYVNKYLKGLYEPLPDQVSKKTGIASVGSAILTSLYERNPIELLKYVIMNKKARKLLSTFVDPLPKYIKSDGRIHPQINVVGTRTGRISGRNPNSLNWNKYTRGQCIAAPGYTFVNFDLGQIEARIVAAFANDDKMLEALYAENFHRATASMMYDIPVSEVTEPQYKAAKIFNFAILYGASPFKLSVMLGRSVQETTEARDIYLDRFEKLKQYIEEEIEKIKNPPHSVYTIFGTKITLYNVLSTDKGIASHAERVAINGRVQGSAGELTLWYCCKIRDRIEEELKIPCGLVNSTYDSATWEIPKEYADKVAEIIRDIIEDTPVPFDPLQDIKFKCDIDISDYWYGKPSIEKALDENFYTGKSQLPWHLITLEREQLSKDEKDEAEELDVLEEENRV
ncbi:MAG TPA: DNA polymerase [Aquella sp.]|nr:DNA polymerase [Aquella sp.]